MSHQVVDIKYFGDAGCEMQDEFVRSGPAFCIYFLDSNVNDSYNPQ
jgi:hypothetical protein